MGFPFLTISLILSFGLIVIFEHIKHDLSSERGIIKLFGLISKVHDC